MKSEPRRRLCELADAYAPSRRHRGLLGDLAIAVAATAHVLLVHGPRGWWYILTGRGYGDEV